MNHPTIASANGNERYNQMLKNAENVRRVKTLAPTKLKTPFYARLREIFIPQTHPDLGKSANSAA